MTYSETYKVINHVSFEKMFKEFQQNYIQQFRPHTRTPILSSGFTAGVLLTKKHYYQR